MDLRIAGVDTIVRVYTKHEIQATADDCRGSRAARRHTRLRDTEIVLAVPYNLQFARRRSCMICSNYKFIISQLS